MALAAVRAAAAPDVAEIVRIQAGTWAAAYAQLVPPAAIEQLAGPAAREAWTAAVGAGDGHHVLVATEGEWTVGFCAAAVATAPEGAVVSAPEGAVVSDEPELGPGAWGEIGVLLVEPRWGRRGHGGRLLGAAATALREAGSLYGLAWIPEADEASRRFYARAGWEPDGATRAFDTGEGVLREVRLTGSLDLKLV
ncbi:GNAT family N-acetyltransferase [Pseudonocardia sp. GCM10023141]|uniref:GNAT family N-acetyltransferase n=1 Tax=Pseudonocardia sp. GCM10023141 TaxID=3252653 RepID=UPI00360CC723